MSIYHCSVKVIGRSSGRSSVASSAYRAGEAMTNEREGVRHDYTKKSWQIVHSEIMLPDGASQQLNDRSFLWNEVERSERRKDSQTAREVEVALPKELNRAEQIEVLREYVKDNFVSNGMCADVNIHDKNDGNPHAHIMLTTRTIGENGLFDKKERSWNDKALLEQWRESWADHCNKYLEPSQQIDHRSYAEQGIDKEPTIHMGGAYAMEMRGISTDRGAINIEIEMRNAERAELKGEIKTLENEIKEIDLTIKTLENKVRYLLVPAPKKEAEQEPAPQKQSYEEMAVIYEKSKNEHVPEPANQHKIDILEKTAEQSAEKIERAIASFSEEERKQFEVTEENCKRFEKELINESFGFVGNTPKLANLNQGKNRAEVKKPAEQELTRPKLQEQQAEARRKAGTIEMYLEDSTSNVKKYKAYYKGAEKSLERARKELENKRGELENTSFLAFGKRKELSEDIEKLEQHIPKLEQNVENSIKEYQLAVENEQTYQKELADIQRTLGYIEEKLAQFPTEEKREEPAKIQQSEPEQNAIFHSPIERLRKKLGMDEPAKREEKEPATEKIIVRRIDYFKDKEQSQSKKQSYSHDR